MNIFSWYFIRIYKINAMRQSTRYVHSYMYVGSLMKVRYINRCSTSTVENHTTNKCLEPGYVRPFARNVPSGNCHFPAVMSSMLTVVQNHIQNEYLTMYRHILSTGIRKIALLTVIYFRIFIWYVYACNSSQAADKSMYVVKQKCR